MKANTILILSHHHQILIDRLQQLGYNVHIHISDDWTNQSFEFEDIVGIVTSNTCPMSKERIALFPNLKFIGRLGSGMEIIDTEYALSKGILCFSSPEGNANAVAEHALGMLINCLKNMHSAQEQLKSGLFLRKENTGRELNSCKVGIIGYGTNGKQFADYLIHFGARVYAHDIEDKEFIASDLFSFSKELDDILSYCDVISFHIPINPATKEKANYILQSIKHPFVLINCARGKLISSQLLLDMLISGQIISAGIDVWEEEPFNLASPEQQAVLQRIVNMPQVIASPHIAGYTFEAHYKMSNIIAEKIEKLYL